MSVNHTNILVAFTNLVKSTQTTMGNASSSHNRANQMGESLEAYVKDLFCDSFSETEANKMAEYNRHFSYLGNQNNPPDIMLRDGDAIEVKKIESPSSQLALNSSHPKDILHSDDPRIKKECRLCEKWSEKDMIYTIGHVNNSEIRYLWFVYGNCYSAHRETYTRISDAISEGINSFADIEFESTNELARVNKVDPLGITYLRVRGMWGIDNPKRVFNYLPEASNKFANLLMLTEKYDSFPEDDRLAIEQLEKTSGHLIINDVQIKNPNNPAELLEAKLISYNL